MQVFIRIMYISTRVYAKMSVHFTRKFKMNKLYMLVVLISIKRYDFIFQTTDNQTIQAYRWVNPNMETREVIQIAHGMVEHSLRYEPFITFLTSHGFIVYANDHRGHGKSFKKKKDKGYFAKKDGFQKVVKD